MAPFGGNRACRITGQMELARHGARTFWGLFTRTAAAIAAHAPRLACPAEA
jgi:hypothetical protein